MSKHKGLSYFQVNPTDSIPRIAEIRIRDIAFGGSGVGQLDSGIPRGKAAFVPFTIDGERVRVRIMRQRRKLVEAAMEEVLEPSPERVEPVCPYFGDCGGCSYQHIRYGHQLEIKARQVEQTIRRVGRIQSVPMAPIVPSPAEYGYRNRIRVHVSEGVTGFFAHGSHRLVDVARCALAADAVNAKLSRLRTSAVKDGDYMLSANEDTRFFEQTNDAVAKAMARVVESALPTRGKVLIDAYCGAGHFARRLLEHFERVIGLEENEFAVGHARKSASPNETYVAGDVADTLGPVLSAEDREDLTLLLDPPAAGVSPRVIDIILGVMPPRLVYVSCNPATLARDLSLLKGGYALTSVTPLDMFPQTAEIEVVAHLGSV